MPRVRELRGIKTSVTRGPLTHLWKMEPGSSARKHTGTQAGWREAGLLAEAEARKFQRLPVSAPPLPTLLTHSPWTEGLVSIAPSPSFTPSVASLAAHLSQGVAWTSCLLSCTSMSRPSPRLTLHLPTPAQGLRVLAPLSTFASISISEHCMIDT